MPYMLPRRIPVLLKSKPGNKPQLPDFLGVSNKQDFSHPKTLESTIPVAVDLCKKQLQVINYRFYTRQYTNSYSPFYTLQKPTCGYLYCQDTDHTRKKLDVPYANTSKWRTDAIL
ncbi:ciliary microtubule inner protein 3 [Macrotis lagotis]|uniref:ciliary microtubule inner protein 3 n=1 Tax=Macrotis lagotis TaxID=92651 RepID=UPI003D6843F3